MESTYSIRKDGRTMAQSPLPNLGYDARTLAGMDRAGYALLKDGRRVPMGQRAKSGGSEK